MVTNLVMSAKMATLGLLEIKVFWNEGYDVIVSVHNFNNKTLSRDSNYIVDVVMRPKFDNSSIFMRKVIITSVAKGLKLKVRRFLGLSSTFVKVTGKKLVGSGGFLLPPSLSHLEQGQCFVKCSVIMRHQPTRTSWWSFFIVIAVNYSRKKAS